MQIGRPSCDLVDSGRQIAGLTDTPFMLALNQTGTFYYACGVPGHCSDGMLVTVQVSGGAAGLLPSLLNTVAVCMRILLADAAHGSRQPDCLVAHWGTVLYHSALHHMPQLQYFKAAASQRTMACAQEPCYVCSRACRS